MATKITFAQKLTNAIALIGEVEAEDINAFRAIATQEEGILSAIDKRNTSADAYTSTIVEYIGLKPTQEGFDAFWLIVLGKTPTQAQKNAKSAICKRLKDNHAGFVMPAKAVQKSKAGKTGNKAKNAKAEAEKAEKMDHNTETVLAAMISDGSGKLSAYLATVVQKWAQEKRPKSIAMPERKAA